MIKRSKILIKKKILITGGNGFVGKNLFHFFDKKNIYKISRPSSRKFDLSNLTWSNSITNSEYTWDKLLNIPVNSNTPYGMVELNGDQQILAIAITTNKVIFNGYIGLVKLTFMDGRYIEMT